jgi:hypothetical protein
MPVNELIAVFPDNSSRIFRVGGSLFIEHLWTPQPERHRISFERAMQMLAPAFVPHDVINRLLGEEVAK